MFKAKLINNKNYYKFRAVMWVLVTIPAIVLATLINYEKLPIWSIILIIVVYILLMILSFKFIKKMNTMLGKEIIEINNNEIRVNAIKSNKKEVIAIDGVDKIILKKEYGIPQESMKDLTKELKGEAKENYLIVHNGNEKRRFDFEIESYYMINQLNKVISQWEEKGFQIERI